MRVPLPHHCVALFLLQDHLYDLEAELKVEKPIKFCLYEDQNGQWCATEAPVASAEWGLLCFFCSIHGPQQHCPSEWAGHSPVRS